MAEYATAIAPYGIAPYRIGEWKLLVGTMGFNTMRKNFAGRATDNETVTDKPGIDAILKLGNVGHKQHA